MVHKKNLLGGVFLFLFLVVALCGIFGAVSRVSAADVNLVLATWEPAQARVSVHIKEWLYELKEKTGGRVSGKISYGAMGPPAKYYDLAVKGIAHVSFVGVPYTPGRFPMSEVMQLPITGEVTCGIFSRAYWELYQKGYFDKEFADVKVLYLGGMAPYELQMTEGNEVKRLSDIRGKKIRVSGAIHTKMIKLLGGSPVGMPAPEIPIAMQKGTIDGQFQFRDFITAFRTDKVTGSVTEIGMSGLTFAAVMNKKIYEKMPGDIKRMIEEMGPRYSERVGELHDKEALEATAMLGKVGAVIYQLPSTDMEELGNIMAPMWEEWIAKKAAKGYPAKKILADLYGVLRNLGVRKPFHGYKP
ncbi:MAG: TRAP transporter substrate-binding protein [Deltaproteobacteria bacterium]|nr:TRAP transporter substrate-binding protein [Deltaproteobacteria bacterium]